MATVSSQDERVYLEEKYPQLGLFHHLELLAFERKKKCEYT